MAQLTIPVFTSGNYIIDTIYLYSRDLHALYKTQNAPADNSTVTDIHAHSNIDNLAIDAIYYILRNASTWDLLSKKNTIPLDISKISIFQNLEQHNLAQKIKHISETILSSISNSKQLIQIKNDNLESIINDFSLLEIKTTQIAKVQNLYISTSNVYEQIKQTLPIAEQIQTTSDYVLLLFSLALAKNYNIDWVTKNLNHESANIDEILVKHKINLQRRNSVIAIFLSIFMAYFKPIMDHLYEYIYIKPNTIPQETYDAYKEKYNNIITFINNIILYYNSAVQLDDTSNLPILNSDNTTYNLNKQDCQNTSEEKNRKNDLKPFEQDKYYDLSYDILDEYNKWLDSQEQHERLDYLKIYQNQSKQNDTISAEYLISNPAVNRKLLIPSIPIADDASKAPVLSIKHGLAQPEIQKIFDNIDLSMCKSNLGFASSAEQFITTGIVEKALDQNIHNNLDYKGKTSAEINESRTDFKILEYFEALFVAYKSAIDKFNILTAINSHYDLIKFVKVGGFDCHIKQDIIKSLVVNCQQNFAVITCITPISSNIFYKTLDIQGAHRSMLIFDLRIGGIGTGNINKKIYYFEPFGQYYLVYDMYGRVIPHIYEMVIAQRLNKIFTELQQQHNNYKIVLPYYIPNGSTEPQLCNTGIFKFNRFNYLGIDSLKVAYINSVINSVNLFNNKTLDWYTGYCGLIVVFMTLLIKINCNMPELNHNGKVDDILIWFNQFNLNPIYTYNNILAQSLIRGFANLIEKLLDNKVSYIEPVIYNLDALDKTILPESQIASHTIISFIESKSKSNEKKIRLLYSLIGFKQDKILNNESVKENMNTIINFIYSHITGNYISNINYNTELMQNLNSKYNEYLNKQNLEPTIIEKITDINPSKHLIKYGIGKVLKTWVTEKFTRRPKIHIIPEKTEAIFQKKSQDRLVINPQLAKILFIDLLSSTQ